MDTIAARCHLTPRRLPKRDRALIADWRRFLFVHYSLPPEVLAPHVPYELDLYGGRAFVSLVFFTLERLRPPWFEGCGEKLLRPVSNHPFLNVRTYVRSAGHDGICFLAEWIPNRLSERLGPMLYGLPYRHGEFEVEYRPDNGVACVRIFDPSQVAALALSYPVQTETSRPCAFGTSESFLLERYDAYTFRGPIRRRFAVAHEPWRVKSIDWIRSDISLVERVFPWFSAASYHSAQVSQGVTDVEMGWPHRVAPS